MLDEDYHRDPHQAERSKRLINEAATYNRNAAANSLFPRTRQIRESRT